jgi:hypothetical protein
MVNPDKVQPISHDILKYLIISEINFYVYLFFNPVYVIQLL